MADRLKVWLQLLRARAAPALRCRSPAFAQSPNTSTIVVLVTDQTGAVVTDAKVSVIEQPDRRRARGGVGQRRQRHVPGAVADGHLHGHRVEAGLRRRGAQRTSRCARGETATLKVKLLVGSEKTEVTVYGTTEGVRADRADRPPARQRRRSTRRRSSAARSRRCRSSTPRSGRARARAISSSTRPTSSPAPAAAARRRSCSTAPATTKAGAARRCSPPCRSAPSRKCRCSRTRFPPSSAGPPAPR